MPPVEAAGQMDFRAGSVSDNSFLQRQHFATRLLDKVEAAKLSNYTVKEWLSDLWAEYILNKSLLKGIQVTDY